LRFKILGGFQAGWWVTGFSAGQNSTCRCAAVRGLALSAQSECQ
jgi:hypothetical protein